MRQSQFLIRMPTTWMNDITMIELFIFGRAPLVSVFPTLAFSNDTLSPHLDFVALNNSFNEFGSPLGAPKTFFGVTRTDEDSLRRRRNVGYDRLLIFYCVINFLKYKFCLIACPLRKRNSITRQSGARYT